MPVLYKVIILDCIKTAYPGLNDNHNKVLGIPMSNSSSISDSFLFGWRFVFYKTVYLLGVIWKAKGPGEPPQAHLLALNLLPNKSIELYFCLVKHLVY